MKTLLGMDSFPLTEEEIIRQLQEARRKKLDEVVFSSPQGKVTVKLRKVGSAGLMREYSDYFLSAH